MAEFLYPEDMVAVVVATQTILAPLTALPTQAPMVGRTDGSIYFSRTRDGTAIAGTTQALTETSTDGTYTCEFHGDDLYTAMTGLPDGASIWRHTVFGTHDVHPVQAMTWRWIRYT